MTGCKQSSLLLLCLAITFSWSVCVAIESNCVVTTDCPTGEECYYYIPTASTSGYNKCTAVAALPVECGSANLTCSSTQYCINKRCYEADSRPQTTFPCQDSSKCDKDYVCTKGLKDYNGQTIPYGLCKLGSKPSTMEPDDMDDMDDMKDMKKNETMSTKKDDEPVPTTSAKPPTDNTSDGSSEGTIQVSASMSAASSALDNIASFCLYAPVAVAAFDMFIYRA